MALKLPLFHHAPLGAPASRWRVSCLIPLPFIPLPPRFMEKTIGGRTRKTSNQSVSIYALALTDLRLLANYS